VPDTCLTTRNTGESALLTNIIGLIVDTAASVMAAILLLRFWAQAVRVRPPESVARFIFKSSNWIVLPLRRVLPAVGGYDWASLIGTMLMAVIAVTAAVWMTLYFSAQFILLLSIQQLLNWIVYGFMGLLIIEVIFSWVNPHAPLAPFISALNEPLLRPLRRLIPPLGGIDLSVLIALIMLRVALQLVSGGLLALIPLI